MQPQGVEKHGSDNSVFVAKLKWDRPNKYAAGLGEPGPQVKPGDKIRSYFSPPQAWQGKFGSYKSPLEFENGAVANITASTRASTERIRLKMVRKM